MLGTLGALGPVKTVSGFISRPILALTSNLGNSWAGWGRVVESVGGLAQENQQLKNDNAALRGRLSQTTELRAQNDELRKQLNVGGVKEQKQVAAEVIGYQPDNFRQFITLGRGSRDGLKTGMAVVSQGALVGLIQEVTLTSARVFLVIDPNFRVTALDQDSASRPTGTIHGQIGNGLVMDKIAQTESVKPGDTVVTTGSSNGLPKGLIIGRVQTVDKRDNGVFQVAQVTSSVAFSRLEIVYVVTKPEGE